MLGQSPTVLTFKPSQQTTKIGTDPPTRFGPGETTRYQLHHGIQRRHPPRKIHHTMIITAGQTSASHDTP
jgi:hypothetical protein